VIIVTLVLIFFILVDAKSNVCVIIQSFIFSAKHLDVVIDLGMGKGSGKNKPLTKKEREARRKKRKENRPQ